MPARRKPTPEQPDTGATFEEAMAELEALVESMEEEELPLEELVSAYEKGSGLLRQCETVLKAARERLELITLRNQAENALDSEAATPHGGAPPAETPEDEPDDDDDIRLF